MLLAGTDSMSKRWIMTTVAVLVVTGGVSASATTASANEAQVAAATGTLSCGTVTATDKNNARALNPRLTSSLKGHLAGYEVSCARAIVKKVKTQRLPSRAAIVAITTAIVESRLRNLSHGDRGRLGLFQQPASWGSAAKRKNATTATGLFLSKMVQLSNWKDRPVGEVCQWVQRSAFPDRYYGYVNDGTTITEKLW